MEERVLAARKSFAEVLAAAEKGDAVAQFEIGSTFFEGLGVPQDYGEAFKWFRRAASVEAYLKEQARHPSAGGRRGKLSGNNR